MKRSDATTILKGWILSGRLARGEFLPPERELADQLGISRPTLRRAIEPLVKEGLLESQGGRGTLVAGPLAASAGTPADWNLLALVLPDISNRFFIEVAESIEYTALQRGFQILLCNSRHQLRLEEFHVRQIVARRIKGVILAHHPHQEVSQSLALLHQAGIPVVLLFSSARDFDSDSVVLDDRAGIDQALRYLVSLGHRNIAFCRPLPGPVPHPREVHFRDFVARSAGIQGDCFVDVVGKTEEQIQSDLRRMLSRENPPTACLAGNDHVALMLMTHLAALKVAIPRRFSLVGFDNLRFVEHLPVPLTTIDQPKQEMGRRAAELLFERLESGPHLPVRKEIFTPHLVIRDSCSIVPAINRKDLVPA